MTTTEACGYSFDRLLTTRAFRHAHCYASATVMELLRDVVGTPALGLVVDIDALERSTLARVDRVMLLALGLLAQTGVQVVLVARHARARAVLIQRAIGTALLRDPVDAIAYIRARRPDAPVVAISDDPDLLGALCNGDRGIALGRPELADVHIASTGDNNVRAMFWWLVHERAGLVA